MTTKVHIEWQYTIPALGATVQPDQFKSFFREIKKDKYQKSLSLTPRYRFTHHSLVPKGNFLETLETGSSDKNRRRPQNFPFHVHSEELTDILDGHPLLIRKIQIDIFESGIITLRISASVEVDIFKNLDECLNEHCLDKLLLTLRSPKQIKTINDIASEIIKRATKPGWKPYLSAQTRCAFKIDVPFDDTSFRKYVDTSKRSLIATHLGIREGSGIAANLVHELEDAWKSLNLKSQTEWMLANTLGITYLVPKNATVSPHPNRFERATNLLAIASHLQLFLLDADNQAEQNIVSWQQQLVLARRWIEFSKNALYASVSNWTLFETLSNSMALKSLISEATELETK